jgi:hypothetical protein
VTPTEREVWINNLEADLNSCVDSNSARYAMGEAYDRVRSPLLELLKAATAMIERLQEWRDKFGQAALDNRQQIEHMEDALRKIAAFPLGHHDQKKLAKAALDTAAQRIRELEG